MAMKKTVVFYPGLAVSHFVPMMQLADALLEEGYAVVVAVIDITNEQNLAFAVDRVAASKPSVTFHTLPRIKDPPTFTNDARFILGYFELVRRYNKHLGDLLRSLPTGSVRAVVVESLSNEAIDVTREMGIPAYTFFAWSASALAACLQLSSIPTEGQLSFRELGDSPLDLLGIPPVPASHLLLEFLEDPKSEIYQATVSSFRKNLEADGILVNAFASLEAQALGALEGPRFPFGPGIEVAAPQAYSVGPLEKAGETKAGHECLAWLDTQSERSVELLGIGSSGSPRRLIPPSKISLNLSAGSDGWVTNTSEG
ncbi:hypothetical protein PVAP13_3KG331500 [Panicum virgatum]|uniref:Uncharacterized protein n=1 Tax=Panicum virgatum TaxID=38727 RepID=A0A8T0UZV8_PANVG|nr:hypothetical protein PVAP13_3KG331500 [Panicum virgatum]